MRVFYRLKSMDEQGLTRIEDSDLRTGDLFVCKDISEGPEGSVVFRDLHNLEDGSIVRVVLQDPWRPSRDYPWTIPCVQVGVLPQPLAHRERVGENYWYVE